MKITILITLLVLTWLAIFTVACNQEDTARTIMTPKTTENTDPLAPPSVEELTKNNFVLPDIPRILCEKLKQMIDYGEKFTLIDARISTDFKLGYIPGAVNIPNGDLSPFYTQEWVSEQLNSLPENEMIIFYCD